MKMIKAYSNHIKLLLLMFISSMGMIVQAYEIKSFCCLKDRGEIVYRKVLSCENVVINESCLDLRNIELEGTIADAHFFSVSDSLYQCIFENKMSWYSAKDGVLFCERIESPLFCIKYAFPKLVAIDSETKLNVINCDYLADGLYCGKDSMTISGQVTLKESSKGYMIFPSLDTLQCKTVANRKDNFAIAYLSKNVADMNVVEEADFYYVYGFDYPIFIIGNRKYLQQGKVLEESKYAYYLEIEPFLLAIKDKQEQYPISNSELAQDEVLAGFRASCVGSKLDVDLTLKKDASGKILVANALGMIYVSQRFTASSGVSQSFHIDLSSYPRGRYVVYLNVTGKSYSRIVNN